MPIPIASATTTMTTAVGVKAQTVELPEDEIDEILYLTRSDSLPELQAHVTSLSSSIAASAEAILASARDAETGNNPAHYACANGLLDVLKYFASSISQAHGDSFLRAQNNAGNTPLHYAALNGHLDAVKFLLDSVQTEHEREEFVALKNHAGKDAVYEAEMADKADVVRVLLGSLGLENDDGDGVPDSSTAEETEEEEEVRKEEPLHPSAPDP